MSIKDFDYFFVKINKIIEFTGLLNFFYKLPIVSDLFFIISEKDRIAVKQFKTIMKEGYDTPWLYYTENIEHLYYWDRYCKQTDGGAIAANVTHVPIDELAECVDLWHNKETYDSVLGSNFKPCIKRFITKEYRGFLYERSVCKYFLKLVKRLS